jgi:hypothetical protein
MKKLLIICILFVAFQGSAQMYNPEPISIVLKNGTPIYTRASLYSYQNYIYFDDFGVPNKIHKDSIQSFREEVKAIKSDKVAYYLNKFASESQAGIGLQVLGTAISIGLSFANVSPYVYLTVPPIISVTGFIIWAASYRHLKKYHLISEAKDYWKIP